MNNVHDTNISGEFEDNYAGTYGGAVYFYKELSDVQVSGRFINNAAKDWGDAIFCMEDVSDLTISALIMNNGGPDSAAIFLYKNTSNTKIINSILLDKIYYTGDISFINDWFGHNATNYRMKAPCESWLFLDGSYSDDGDLTVVFNLNNLYNSSSGIITHPDVSALPDFAFDLTAVNAVLDKNAAAPGESVSFARNSLNDAVIKASLGDAYYSIKAPGINVVASDVNKYYGSSESFVVTVTDSSNNPVSDVYVNVTIDGETFGNFTDKNGQYSIPLDLNPGNYSVTTNCEAFEVKSTVNIYSTIKSSDVTGTYGNTKFKATLLDSTGKAVANKNVKFDINGSEMSAKTNANGVASVNVDLGVGDYIVTTTNPVTGEVKTNNIAVSKASTSISLSESQSKTTVTLAAALNPNNIAGKVKFNVSGKTYNANIKNGVATLTLSNLDVGVYSVKATFAGDSNHTSSSDTILFHVNEYYIILEAPDVTKYYHGPERFVVTLTDSENNTVSNASVDITLNGNTYTRTTNKNGQASLAINLPEGTYDVLSKYGSINATSKVTVKSTVSAEDVSGVYGNTTFRASFLDTSGNALANTEVQFKINSTDFNATTDSSGVASVNVDLGAGNYVVTTTNPVTGEVRSNKIAVSKASTSISLSESQSKTTVTLAAALNPNNIAGKVKFNVSGKTYNANIKNGVATLTLSNLDVGVYSVKATFAGDSNHTSSSDTILFHVNEYYIILEAPDVTKYYHGPERFVVTLTDSENNTVSNASVDITLNGNTYTRTTNKNGQASLAINLPEGTYDVVSRYGYMNATSKVTVKSTVSAEDVSGVYGNITFTASFLDTSGKALANREVLFKINSTEFRATTDSNGVARLDVTSNAGSYVITSVNPVNSEEITNNLVISKVDTSMDISKAMAVDGVVLSSNINPATTVGKVTFTINGTDYDADIKDGVASVTVTDLTPGNYTAYAKFAGDSNYNPAESGNITVTVKDYYYVISAPDVSKYYGGSERFVVTLTDSDNKTIADAPVNITINGKTYTRTTDSNGQASLGLNLPVGKYAAITEFDDDQVESTVTVKSTISADDVSGVYANTTFKASFLDTEGKALANREVQFDIGGKLYAATTDSSGVASLKVDLNAGSYVVNSINPASNEQIANNLVISKANSSISISQSLSADGVVLSANVNPSSATGNVTFTVNGTDYVADIKDGAASVTLSDLAAGNYVASAKYVGDNDYNPSQSDNITVVVKEYYVILTAPDVNKYYGGPQSFVVTLTNMKGVPISKAEIKVTIDGVTSALTTDSNGQASLALDLPAGEYDVLSVYKDDNVTSKVTVKSTVSASDVSGSYGNTTFEASFLDASGKELANREVQFKVNSTVFKASTDSKGVAAIKVDLASGEYEITSINSVTGEEITNCLSISKVESSISIAQAMGSEGLVLSANVNPITASGKVIFTVNGTEYDADIENGVAKVTVPNLTAGEYVASAEYAGDSNYDSSNSGNITFTIGDYYVVVSAPDVTKYFKGPERFVVNLTDSDGKAVVNASVNITINGNTYTRVTDSNGIASMAVNLNSGVYEVLVEYNGSDVYSTVIIKSTVSGDNVVKMFKNGTQYYAAFVDTSGKAFAENTAVEFNINGVFYTRYTNAEGVARMNINLNPGEYIITAKNPNSTEMYTNIITVLPTIVENYDLTKYYKNASQYSLRLLDDQGNPVGAGVEIRLNINGVFYTRASNATGYVKMNINLNPGEYIITAEYNGLMASNTIKVLPTIETHDLSMKYKDGSKFEAKVLDGQGKPYAGQNVTFNINGVFYDRVSDENGIARLSINLMAGEYIITSTFNGLNAANKVTISS